MGNDIGVRDIKEWEFVIHVAKQDTCARLVPMDRVVQVSITNEPKEKDRDLHRVIGTPISPHFCAMYKFICVPHVFMMN